MERYLPAALLLALAGPALAAGPPAPRDARAAVAKALPLIRKAGAGHMAHRTCFACHNQALPVMALTTAPSLAVRGLQAFGTDEQKHLVARRVRAARAWLVKTPAKDTEDRVFRLWGLQRAGAGAKEVRGAAQELLKTQGPDGGWAQKRG